ncbi:MAG: hypothetical protein ACQEP5_10360 [Actinomycetota bacterium]
MFEGTIYKKTKKNLAILTKTEILKKFYLGDVSLFVLGLFPEYVFFDYRYPSTKNLSSGVTGKFKKTAQEYESEEKTYYKKAAETKKT